MRLKTRLTEKLGIEHPILGLALSSSSLQRGMPGLAAGSSPGRWREIRSYSIRLARPPL